MSTSVQSKPLTLQQRAAAATARAAELLRLDDIKRLAAAVAEVAADELLRDPDFAQRVRGRYEQLAPRKPVRTTPRPATAPRRATAAATASPDDDLVIIKQVDPRNLPQVGLVDPYFLHEIYGAHQLRRALERHPLRKLQEASALVEERNPGTRPTKKTDKAAIVDYIVAHVTT